MSAMEITKSYYEDISFTFLKRSTPMLITIKGEDFETFTKHFQKPHDPLFMKAMQETLLFLCQSVPGCAFGYTEAFEFTLAVLPPSDPEMPSWFTWDVQRISSLTASMASMKFNKLFENAAKSYVSSGSNLDETRKITAVQGYINAIDRGALFSGGCFNLPKEEIFKYLYLKQKTALDHAVREMGSAFFEAADLAGKSAGEIQFMVFEKANINFDNYPSDVKRGAFCLKKDGRWVIDHEMPMLKDENRQYIDGLL